MSKRLGDHDRVEPRERVQGEGVDAAACFFPNEVARSLAIEQIDYSQLRGFFRLIRNPSGDPELEPTLVGRGWSRFTFSDMAALLVAIDLCGGPTSLQPGRRLTRTNLKEACAALHTQGFAAPLLNVRLHRIGRRVFADVNGIVQDPVSGQLRIRDVAEQADEFFDRRLLRDPDLAEALEAEVRRHRA